MSTLAAVQAWQDLGISRPLVQDLALKVLYLRGEISLRELSEHMRISYGILEDVFYRFRKDQLCEVKGMVGSVHIITTTSAGKARAIELLSQNQYAGPTPVSLEDYTKRILEQSIRSSAVGPSDVEKGFAHLVLTPETLTQIGTAAVSGTSIFIYGPPGTGKTAIAETLPSLYQDSVWVPHAVEVDGQIITVFDSSVHEPLETKVDTETDSRWVLCKRPRIIAGGELTIEMLELQFNPITKFYSAPLQMKANNGVLIIDDFGRQRMRPEEMLNRWIVPLDRRIDYLTVVGGKKFEIPFDLFVAFATNLEPRHLVDEAFLRRIANKIQVNYVTEEQFHAIFRSVCEHSNIDYNQPVVDQLIGLLNTKYKEPLRPCYARDVVRQVCWAARYEGKAPQLDADSVEQACRRYFVSS